MRRMYRPVLAVYITLLGCTKMSASDLISRLQADAASGKSLDFRAVREEIHDLSNGTEDVGERVVLLATFHAVMDMVERSGNVAPENLDAFRMTRAQDYRLLLMREVLIGENASAELLNAVTQREVLAGRMREDDDLRQVAITAISEPYLTVQQLLQVEHDRLAAPKETKGWRKWFSKR